MKIAIETISAAVVVVILILLASDCEDRRRLRDDASRRDSRAECIDRGRPAAECLQAFPERQ